MWLYENFELYNPFISIELIVWSIFAGIVVASLLAVYNKRVIGGFVKKLLSEESFSPEKAKTVAELGYTKDWVIENALRRDSVLRRFVVRAGEENEEEKKDAEKKADKNGAQKSKKTDIDFVTARFYIPEEQKYSAEVRYASKGTNLVSLAVGLVICAAAAIIAVILIPDLIQLIDNFIGSFS